MLFFQSGVRPVLRKTINSFKPIFNLYQMDKPISVLRVVGGIFHSNSNSYRKFCKQTVEKRIRRNLWRLVWSGSIRRNLWRLVWSGSALFADAP